jgi:uncharacterized damage-inducible protein DinB
MNEGIAANFLAFSVARMRASQEEIHRCLERLSEEQMAYRGGDHENSVINLLLHLAGNIRQWAVHGVGGKPDVRRREEEFALDPKCLGAEARARFDGAIEEAAAIIAGCSPARLQEIIDPQPTGKVRHPTVLEAIYRVVGHLDHHTGQIILLTKQLTRGDLDLSIPRPRA